LGGGWWWIPNKDTWFDMMPPETLGINLSSKNVVTPFEPTGWG
jgi:hypothetical protein